jgi:hypothetical protein
MRRIDAAIAEGTDEDRISRLEREVAELRRDLAALLGFAERLAEPQAARPANRQSDPKSRR